MARAVSAVEQPAIQVDRSKTYRVNAGRCEHCGNFKTWDFRIPNPKSGKMMPGHVTEEGYKIDDGGCPYWAAVKKKRSGGTYERNGNYNHGNECVTLIGTQGDPEGTE